MKTWILKSDLSYSPQAAFRIYACGVRRQNTNSINVIINSQVSQSFLISKIKSQLKSLSRWLEQKQVNVVAEKI